mmetsp:Transcript_9169/g.22483  ORF Transcript_9169/g.22483 Transcript_9169/m.22483 type:complete len:140 (+) Transcript_9169:765-1184(+)
MIGNLLRSETAETFRSLEEKKPRLKCTPDAGRRNHESISFFTCDDFRNQKHRLNEIIEPSSTGFRFPKVFRLESICWFVSSSLKWKEKPHSIPRFFVFNRVFPCRWPNNSIRFQDGTIPFRQPRTRIQPPSCPRIVSTT